MTAVKAITVSGFKICTTSGDGGIPLVRFKDVMLAFGHRENMIDKALWRRVANTIIEGVHWVRMENPFTLKQDLFLTISGTGVIAATECRNHEVAREIVHQMAASWEREMIGSRKVRSDIATTDDHEMVFLQGLLDSVGAARREAKQAHIEATQARIESQEALSAAHRSEASSQSVLEAIEKVERDVRDYITARKFCRDEGIPAGKADKNIKELGARASRICRSEGIKFLFHARTDGDFAANAYPSWVLARAAREIGLIH